MTKTEKKPEAAAKTSASIEPRWLTYSHAGAYMGGITAEAVRMMVRRGRLPHVKQGKRTYIDRLDIDRIMEAHKVMPAA